MARVLLPDGSARLLPISHDLTIHEATQTMLEQYAFATTGASQGVCNGASYVLQVPGTGEILAESDAILIVSDCIRSYLQYRRVPLLRLRELTEAQAYARAVKSEGAEASVAVTELLGNPLSWSSESEEVINFRQAMLRLRPTPLAELAAQVVARSLPTYKDPTPPLESLPATFKIRLYLREHEVVKTIMGTQHQKVSDLLNLAYSNYARLATDGTLGAAGFEKGAPHTGYSREQMVLKFASLNEFLVDGELIDYCSVRRLLKRGKFLSFRLIPHPFVNHSPLPAKARTSPTVPSSRASSFVDAFGSGEWQRSAATSAPDVVPAQPHTFSSVRELSPEVKMRIRIISVQHTGVAMPFLAPLLKGAARSAAVAAASAETTDGGNVGSGGMKFSWAAQVKVGLFNGGVLLCSQTETSVANGDEGTDPRWNEWLQTDLVLSQAPRTARVCFTVFGRPLPGTSSKAGSVPLGWVSLPLFDHNNVLASRIYALRLWPGGEANPIGTPVENVSVNGPETPSLFVQFDTFDTPLVMPPIHSNELGSELICSSSVCSGLPPPEVIMRLKTITELDPLHQLTAEEKELLWRHRHFILSSAEALPKFLQCSSWTKAEHVCEMHALLRRWDPPRPVAALQLLDAKFADAAIRSYAVDCLEDMHDTELAAYLLQLVQGEIGPGSNATTSTSCS